MCQRPIVCKISQMQSFSEINKKAIFLYRLMAMASRSNCCFLYRGVDRGGHLKASASEPVQKFSEQ